MRIRPARPEEHAALVALWERSVRATHGFLTNEDILMLRPLVAEELAKPTIGWWVLASHLDTPLGFLGFAHDAVEALFMDLRIAGVCGVRPDAHGFRGPAVPLLRMRRPTPRRLTRRRARSWIRSRRRTRPATTRATT
jgi:hypothetical protein